MEIGLGITLILALFGASAMADEPQCGQGRVEKTLGVKANQTNSLQFIEPAVPVQIIYQWNANNGYCGEASLISAGLANGQYMSQADARLACGAFMGKASGGMGASLLQSGEMGATSLNYNAQLLLEDAAAGVSGANDFGQGARCAANSGLKATTYPFKTGYKTANIGDSGVKDYLSWIKSEMIAGHHVTIGVLWNGGDDAQYDHIVSVVKIGTNHDVNDPSYYPDDVLYFDDHGLYTLQFDHDGGWDFTDNPASPVGAGGHKSGCTPYLFAYAFDKIAKTRKAANKSNAPAYSLIIPSSDEISVIAGNTAREGDGLVQINGPHNYALSVHGPLDMEDDTQKVSLKIVSSRRFEKGVWTENPRDPIAGFNYENPYMSPTPDGCDDGECLTNIRPEPMQIELVATIHGLVVGRKYKVVEYDFPFLNGSKTGRFAAMPDDQAQARYVTRFTAVSTEVALPPVQRMSNQLIKFRVFPDEDGSE